jgi:hypothetical protein
VIDDGKLGIAAGELGTVTSKDDPPPVLAAAADATGPVAANATAIPPTAATRPSARLI